MRLAHLFVTSLFVGAALTACGDDGGSTTPDAAVVVDAAPDAPAALTGLGQACAPSGGTPCPMEAPVCLHDGTKGFCSKTCVDDGMLRTNAMAMPMTYTPMPATQTSMCTAIFTGTVGTAVCSVPFDLRPALVNGMLAANTTYTLDWGCGIQCGASNTCPTGLTCNTQVMLCNP